MTTSLRVLLPAVTTLTLLGIWQALAVTGVAPAEIPAPTEIGAWLAGNLFTADLATAVGLTLAHWAAALVVGVAAGAVLGWLMASVPLVNTLLLGTVEFFRPIPVVVFLPMMLLLLGATPQVVVILAAVAALWPMLLQTLYGVAAVDPVMRDTAQVYGLTGRQQLMWVTARSVLPYVSTGVRISSTITLLVAIGIELIGAVPGLGQELATYATNGVYEATYGVLVVAGVLGVLLNTLFERLERRTLHWHPTHRT